MLQPIDEYPSISRMTTLIFCNLDEHSCHPDWTQRSFACLTQLNHFLSLNRISSHPIGFQAIQIMSYYGHPSDSIAISSISTRRNILSLKLKCCKDNEKLIIDFYLWRLTQIQLTSIFKDKISLLDHVFSWISVFNVNVLCNVFSNALFNLSK